MPDDYDDEDGGLRNDLRAALASATTVGDDDTDGVTIVPADDPAEPEKLISQAEAAQLASEAATVGRSKPVIKDEEPKPEPVSTTPAEPEKPVEQAKPEDTAEKPVTLATATIDALIDGLPDDRRAELSSRLTAAAKVTDLFKGHEAELQRHGATPEMAVARFLELNAFAQQKPDEYLAWVVKEVAGDKGLDVLQKAAGHLGLKLVPETEAEPEDDPFEDPAIKALRAENRELKNAQRAQPRDDFGPDAPARRVQREIDNFRTETDPTTGQLKRPLFTQLGARIGELAQAHKASTGQNVTVADLDRIYVQAETEARQALGLPAQPPTIAAAAPAAVQQDDKGAAAIAKAKAASKSLDGSGQGTGHQPATQDTGDVRDTIRRMMAGI